MTTAAAGWNALPPQSRASWHRYAAQVPVITRCNPQTYLSGREHFCRTAIVANLFGGAGTGTAPTSFTRPGFTRPRIVYPAGFAPPPALTFQVHFNTADAWCFDQKAVLCIVFSDAVPQTRTAWYRAYANRAGLFGQAGGLSSPQTLSFPLIPANDERVFWKVRLLRGDGRVSELFRPVEQRNPPIP